MKRIFIADDHDIVRSGLRAILEARADWTIVGEATNGRDAIDRLLREKPDVLIIDFAMPLINGVEVTRQIKSSRLPTEVLMFTMHDSEMLVQNSIKVGVGGFLLKSDVRKYLIPAVEALLAHKPFFKGVDLENAMDVGRLTQDDAGPLTLSAREESVLKLIAEGSSNKKMAEALSISVKTVENHRASLMRKLDVNSVAGLVRFAIRKKLIDL